MQFYICVHTERIKLTIYPSYTIQEWQSQIKDYSLNTSWGANWKKMALLWWESTKTIEGQK